MSSDKGPVIGQIRNFKDVQSALENMRGYFASGYKQLQAAIQSQNIPETPYQPGPADYPPNITGLQIWSQGDGNKWLSQDLGLTWCNITTVELDPNLPAGTFVYDPYFLDYVVEIFNADGVTLRRQEKVTTNWYVYSYVKNFADGGSNGAAMEVIVKVWAQNQNGNMSVAPAILDAKNTGSGTGSTIPPSVPTNLLVTGTKLNIYISWDTDPDPQVMDFEVDISTDGGVTWPTVVHCVHNLWTFQGVVGTTYTVRIQARSYMHIVSGYTANASGTLAGVVGSLDIVAASIPGSAIALATITGANITAATITGNLIAANTIVGGNIYANTITAAQIAAGTITANEIAASTITGDRLVAGTITATQIAAGTITATQIAANTITASQIKAGTITATEISASYVYAGNLNASQITAGQITATYIDTTYLHVTYPNVDNKPAFPTLTAYTSGSGTYTVPSGAASLHVRIVGGGGGGSGGGGGGVSGGGNGGSSTFASAKAGGGSGAPAPTTLPSVGGAGGSPSGSGWTWGFTQSGAHGDMGIDSGYGGAGANSPFGGGGSGGGTASTAGYNATTYGSGGGGGGDGGTSGGGGGAGAFLEIWYDSPSGTYSYAVGSGGSAGSQGQNGAAGGTGAGGIVIVESFR